MDTKLKFIDLFAGIGGFHLALKDLNGKCVFVSEFDDNAIETYKKNFKIEVAGDIEKIDEKNIPSFDFLCAGFPCQPFSKGGYREGFEDRRGKLFFKILKIVKHHEPDFALLENVPNLATHNNGHTYKVITEEMNRVGYLVPNNPLILSPHEFGQPVYRPRLYIPCIKKSKLKINASTLNFNFIKNEIKTNIYDLIDFDKKPQEFYITKYEEMVLEMWNEFYKNIDIKVIGFPIWAEQLKCNNDTLHHPKWKQNILIKNRELYKRNKKFIDSWFKKYDNLSWCTMTHKKFEWQAGKDCSDIYECLIQFRPSGVRAKRPDRFSTLVAMNHSQIIGKYRRRLTPDETKRLQAIPKNFKLHKNRNIALRQLGNSVNVEVIKQVSKKMLEKVCG